MVRSIVLGLVTLLALAGAVSACPFDKNAQTTTTDQTTASSQPLPLSGTDGTTTETKTGG